MISKAFGSSLIGINSFVVTVEADVSNGLPQFGIVGLPDSSVREARERVLASLKNTGINLQGKRITVNLAPSNIKKAGTAFDLPIAVAIMGALSYIPMPPNDYLFTGELSLDGKINAVNGILAIIYEARKRGKLNCFVPIQNAREASFIEGVRIYPAGELSEVIAHLTDKKRIQCINTHDKKLYNCAEKHSALDYADVKGHELVKRAFAIAAAGRHNIFISGPPGVGKTMLACRLPSIMPPMTFDESIEATKLFSVRGLINDSFPLVTERPFRVAHHTISRVALVGGGTPLLPGEVSLAHTGVLFLDEFAEFPRNVLEALRQPMEDGRIVVTRIAESSVTFPANFMLVAASNPCPCGKLGTEGCHCSDNDISKYLDRISGPLLDRIDIKAELTPVEYESLSGSASETSSAVLSKNVSNALEMQRERFKNEKILFNADMDAGHISKYCPLSAESSRLLESAYKSLSLSARAYHKILKLARTIADYECSDKINAYHVAEAIGYRNDEKRSWGK